MGEVDSFNDPSRPDGGIRGWIAVLALWARDVIAIGAIKGFGVMLPALEEQLDTQAWIIGWTTSLILAVAGFSAIFAKLVERQFGNGYVIMACAVMVGSAFIAGSFVQTALQLACIVVPLVGIGIGVSDIVGKEAVSLLFNKNYATANGIARTGYSVGLLAYAPLVQLFLNTYGWRGTMLLSGGMTMHLVVCGALMVTTSRRETGSVRSYQTVPTDDGIISPSSSGQEFRCKAVCKTFFAKFDVALLLDSRFWAIAMMRWCSSFSFNMWTIYFVAQCLSCQFSTRDAGTFVAVAGVANLLAKVLQGPMTDREVITNSHLVAIFTVIAAVSYSATPWQTSYYAMLTLSCFVVFSDGVLGCQIDVFLKQALEPELLGGAFAWVEVTYAMIVLVFGFVPGWLADYTGSFTITFQVIGFIQGVSLLPILNLKARGHIK